MEPELTNVLAWGIPGLVIWLVGEALVFRSVPEGRRAARIGFAILLLGVTFGLALPFFVRGQFLIGLAAALVLLMVLFLVLRPEFRR
jgi:peptidoglycan/LPS O-acetylase OafA/YrhL